MDRRDFLLATPALLAGGSDPLGDSCQVGLRVRRAVADPGAGGGERVPQTLQAGLGSPSDLQQSDL